MFKNVYRVLVQAAHTLKLERYREDEHGPCARMTCKFMKRLKNVHRGFSGGPVVRTPRCRGKGLTPGLPTMCGHTRLHTRRTKILHSQKRTNKKLIKRKVFIVKV